MSFPLSYLCAVILSLTKERATPNRNFSGSSFLNFNLTKELPHLNYLYRKDTKPKRDVKMKTKSKEQQKFEEICNGYGFSEIPQSIDGVYCNGCGITHKRPTKMYSNGEKRSLGESLCRFQVIYLYPIEED